MLDHQGLALWVILGHHISSRNQNLGPLEKQPFIKKHFPLSGGFPFDPLID